MLSREQKWAIKMHGHGPIDDDNQIVGGAPLGTNVKLSTQ